MDEIDLDTIQTIRNIKALMDSNVEDYPTQILAQKIKEYGRFKSVEGIIEAINDGKIKKNWEFEKDHIFGKESLNKELIRVHKKLGLSTSSIKDKFNAKRPLEEKIRRFAAYHIYRIEIVPYDKWERYDPYK